MVNAERGLPVVEEEAARSRQLAQGDGGGRAVDREGLGRTVGALGGRQEAQERRDLRAVAHLLLKERAARLGRHAGDGHALTESSIPPTLQREEEERAVFAADVGLAALAEARKVWRPADGSAQLILDAERGLAQRVRARVVAEARGLVEVAARVERV